MDTDPRTSTIQASNAVVLTGLGAATGYGVGADALWAGITGGASAVGSPAGFDASGFGCGLAAQLPDSFQVRDWTPKGHRKWLKVMARDIGLAVAAAHAAVVDAGLATKAVRELAEQQGDPALGHRIDPARLGCQIGAGLIACDAAELGRAMSTAAGEGGTLDLRAWGERGMGGLTPLWMLKYLPNMLACHVTILHDARGPSNTITCGEASGLLCLGESARALGRGVVDACFAGGVESRVNPHGMLRQELAGRLAAPAGELGGVVIAETARSAEARGVRVYAEVAGMGSAQAPALGGAAGHTRATAAAVGSALQQAGLAPEDVGVVFPQACGSPEQDAVEAAGLRAVFGGALDAVTVAPLMPHLGQGGAGAGAVGVCAAALSLFHQRAPARLAPLAGSAFPVGDPSPARAADLGAALVCASSGHGQHAAVVLRRAG